MIIGIILYSYTISSISNLVSSINSRNSKLNDKLDKLGDLCNKYKISENFQNKLKNALEYEHKNNQNKELNLFLE